MYNYQKWRWLAVHQAEHAKADALKHRRIAAADKRLKQESARRMKTPSRVSLEQFQHARPN